MMRDGFKAGVFCFIAAVIVATPVFVMPDAPPWTLHDDAGRTIVFQKPFSRIISLYPAHTDTLFALNAADCLIGIGRQDTVPDDYASVLRFSYHDDPEKLLAASPDLILIRPFIDQGYPRFVKQLERQGITVISLHPQTMGDLFAYWRLLGTLTGKAREAETVMSAFNTAVMRIQNAVAANVKTSQRVYFEAVHGKFRTFSPTSMAVFVLETAGGINAANDARPVRGTSIAYYGKERLLSKAGDIDVYLAQSGRMNPVTIAEIQSEPGFDIIKAIQNGRVHLIDEALVSRPTPRLIEGIMTVGRILYPCVFNSSALKDLSAPIVGY